jgi:hypothetical protein
MSVFLDVVGWKAGKRQRSPLRSAKFFTRLGTEVRLVASAQVVAEHQQGVRG